MRRLTDVGFFYIAQQILNLRAIILIPIITNALGVAAYGTLVLAWNTANLATTIVAFAFPHALVRLHVSPHARAAAGSVLITLASFMVLPWCVVAVALILVANWYGPHLDVAAPWLLGTLVATKAILEAWYFLFSSYWLVTDRNHRYSSLQVVFYTGDLIAVLTALLLQQSVLAVLLFSALWEAAYVGILVWSILSETGLGQFDTSKLRRYLGFSAPLIVPQLMLWMLNQSDRYILAAFRDTSIVGAYNAAYNLANLIIAYGTSVWLIVAPAVARRFDTEGENAARRELEAAFRIIAALALPMAVGLSALAAPVLQLLLGGYVAPDLLVVVPLSCVGAIGYILYGAASWSFQLHLKSRFLALFSFVAGTLNVAANLVLVPPLGALGAGLTTAVCYLGLAAVCFYVGGRYLVFPVPWRFLLRASLAASIMGAILLAIRPAAHLSALLLTVVGAAALYFVLLCALGGVTRDELRLLFKTVSGFASRNGVA